MAATGGGTRPIPVALIAAFFLGMATFFAIAAVTGARTAYAPTDSARGWFPVHLAASPMAAAMAAMATWYAGGRSRKAVLGAAMVALFGYFTAVYLAGGVV